MGTRNTLKVTINGKKVVDNYGQWDGYPTGQGADLLHFLESEHNVRTFIRQMKYYPIEFVDESKISALEKELAMPNASEEAKDLYRQMTVNCLFNRDWGCSILYALTYGNCGYGKRYMVDNGIDTWGGQEGNYLVEFTTTEEEEISATIKMEFWGHERTYTLDNMPKGKNIDKEMEKWENSINNDA